MWNERLPCAVCGKLLPHTQLPVVPSRNAFATVRSAAFAAFNFSYPSLLLAKEWGFSFVMKNHNVRLF